MFGLLYALYMGIGSTIEWMGNCVDDTMNKEVAIARNDIYYRDNRGHMYFLQPVKKNGKIVKYKNIKCFKTINSKRQDILVDCKTGKILYNITVAENKIYDEKYWKEYVKARSLAEAEGREWFKLKYGIDSKRRFSWKNYPIEVKTGRRFSLDKYTYGATMYTNSKEGYRKCYYKYNRKLKQDMFVESIRINKEEYLRSGGDKNLKEKIL